MRAVSAAGVQDDLNWRTKADRNIPLARIRVVVVAFVVMLFIYYPSFGSNKGSVLVLEVFVVLASGMGRMGTKINFLR